jgi:hypothetical protein
LAGLLLASALALPPPASVAQAAHQLRLPGVTRQRAALANLKKVCRGPQRHGFRDQKLIEAALLRMGKKASPALWRPLLDSFSCFTATAFLPVLTRGLNHADPSVGAYAAEIAGRLNQPAVIPALLTVLKAQAKLCSSGDPAGAWADRCVWLTYAPGAALYNARPDDPVRDRVVEAVSEMTRSTHPKVREVAVETLHTAGRPAAIEPLRRMIALERKKGGFARPNRAAMVARFDKRLRALEASNGAKR